MAETVIQRDSFGLNKAARLQAAREAQQVLDAPPPLDPDFPYRALPFDPVWFGAADALTPLDVV